MGFPDILDFPDIPGFTDILDFLDIPDIQGFLDILDNFPDIPDLDGGGGQDSSSIPFL